MTLTRTNPTTSSCAHGCYPLLMEKKRHAVSPPDHPPPPKQFRPNESTVASSSQPNDTADSLVSFQRAQLAAKIAEQNKEIAWLREKVEELQKLVAVLDAAPRAALYHMGAVREDLTLTIARMGLSQTVDMSQSPIAAVMLNAEEVTNQSLGEMPEAIKKLTAQIALTIEAKERPNLPKDPLKEANDELHKRLRQVSDQLERFAEREKQTLVSSTTAKDEYDDLRAESSMQRRRIVSLEQKVQEKQQSIDAQKMEEVRREEESMPTTKTENGKEPNESTVHSSTHNDEAYAALKELAERRLQELREAHEEFKKTAAETETLRADIARRDASVVPINSILNSALYQTMEANLQQLYLKQNTWTKERDNLNKELEAQRKDSQEQIEAANSALEKITDEFKKQLEDLRRVADAAKMEKDKVDMKYDARHTEHATAASVIEAANKRASVSNTIREKLEKENQNFLKELQTLREQMRELEVQVKEKGTVESQNAIDRLLKQVEEERAKAQGFIDEVESLSNMFGEVEGENEKLVKLLTEKEQVLSKVMAERLRGRQLLTTAKEEQRVLQHGREIDADKIKQLTLAVAASKKLAQEATAASLKGQQEARELSQTLEKRRRIADDATVASRTAIAEKNEMMRERDAYKERSQQAMQQHADDRFQANRLREELEEVNEKVKEAEEALQRHLENGKTMEADPIRDEIIRELRKKLSCSIVTNKPKEIVLLRCGHLFSRQCTDDLISTRNRKCPICGKAFGNDDVRPVFF